MITVDYSKGNIIPAIKKRAKNVSLTSTSFGDIQISRDKKLSDVILITSWNKLDRLNKEQIIDLLRPIKQKAKDVCIHVIIMGSKSRFYNNQFNRRSISKIEEVLNLWRLEKIKVHLCETHPFMAKKVVDIQDGKFISHRGKITIVNSKKELELKKKLLEEKALKEKNDIIPKSTVNIKPLEKTTSKIVREQNIDIKYNEELVNIYKEETKKEELINEKELINDNNEEKEKLINKEINEKEKLWLLIPGISDKISEAFANNYNFHSIFNAKPDDIASLKYRSGTKYGISRANKIIKTLSDVSIQSKILATIDVDTSILDNHEFKDLINVYKDEPKKYVNLKQLF